MSLHKSHQKYLEPVGYGCCSSLDYQIRLLQLVIKSRTKLYSNYWGNTCGVHVGMSSSDGHQTADKEPKLNLPFNYLRIV
jgi:hypothetical protein